MAMPGTPSGENHSSESHTCGLNSMPRRSRSAYSRRTCRASGARWIESFRSQKRIASSCSSERRVQRRAGARAAILDRRVVDIARKDEWLGGKLDRKSTRLNSSHEWISYAVFCLKKKKQHES